MINQLNFKLDDWYKLGSNTAVSNKIYDRESNAIYNYMRYDSAMRFKFEEVDLRGFLNEEKLTEWAKIVTKERKNRANNFKVDLERFREMGNSYVVLTSEAEFELFKKASSNLSKSIGQKDYFIKHTSIPNNSNNGRYLTFNEYTFICEKPNKIMFSEIDLYPYLNKTDRAKWEKITRKKLKTANKIIFSEYKNLNLLTKV